MMSRGWLLVVLFAVGCQSEGSPDQMASPSHGLLPDVNPLSVSTAGISAGPSSSDQWTGLDDALLAPEWTGDYDEGSLFAPLWRGASSAIEDFVYAPPGGDCRPLKGTVRVDWSKAQNRVHFSLKVRAAPLHPVVQRTDGVDWWPDPFHQAPKDIDDGAYRFWIVFTNTRLATLYYDGRTLDLLGSEFEFTSGPPPGSIPISIPVTGLFASQRIRPNAAGYLFHEFDIRYDRVTVEGGTFSVAYDTFPPLNLCQGFPALPTLGQQRPWVSRWLPADAGPSWAEVLRSGLAFDTTIDETRVYPGFGDYFPYIHSGATFVGNGVSVQGGVPNGWRLSIPSVIQQVAPLIRTIDGGNGAACRSYVNDPHVDAPFFCRMGGAGMGGAGASDAGGAQ
jgi:hypothetical protein